MKLIPRKSTDNFLYFCIKYIRFGEHWNGEITRQKFLVIRRVSHSARSVSFHGVGCSYNIIYLVVCSLCRKHYAGRSTRTLRTRIGEHRRYYYQIIDNKPFQLDNDDFALGSHLYHEHGCRNRSDFNKFYKVSLLEICSPKVIDMKEHLYIHRLNSLNPNGLNISNPLSIPVLYK